MSRPFLAGLTRKPVVRAVALLVSGALGALAGVEIWTRGAVAPESATRDATPTSIAPWGDLEKVPVTFQPPVEHVDPSFCSRAPTSWHFGDASRERVAALLGEAGITDKTRDELVAAAHCDRSGHACVVEPPREVVLGLSQEGRGALYRVLAENDQNTQHDPFTRRRERFAEWMKLSELRPATVDMLNQLLYYDGDVAELADVAIACATVDDEERVRLARALVRTPSVMVQLRIPAGADHRGLVAYWGRGNRRESVAPVLDAAARAPSGATISIVNLLPPLARLRVNTYPTANDPPYNCWWSALNFWEEKPRDDLMDPAVALATIARDYDETSMEAARFGDLVLLRDGRGAPLHVAVQIADDIVFTKNGHSPGRPWTFNRLEDLRVVYANARSVHVYRRRDLPD